MQRCQATKFCHGWGIWPGADAAATSLWEAYSPCLATLARRELGQGHCRAADEEDVRYFSIRQSGRLFFSSATPASVIFVPSNFRKLNLRSPFRWATAASVSGVFSK